MPRIATIVALMALQGPSFESLLLEARVLRERGDVKKLESVLLRARAQKPASVVLAYALAELHASWGACFDAKRAVAELRELMPRLEEATLPELRRYRGDSVSLEALRRGLLVWRIKLEAREEILPPPVVDRAGWQARLRSLRAQRQRVEKRIAVHQARIRRLQKQLETVGDLRRKDGWSNRQRIFADIRDNERAIDKARASITRLDADITTAERVVPPAPRRAEREESRGVREPATVSSRRTARGGMLCRRDSRRLEPASRRLPSLGAVA